MKKIKYIFICIMLSMSVGCSNFLDTNPSTSASEEQIFNSVKGADAAYNGAFSYLMEWFNSYAYPGYRSILIMADVTAEDVAPYNAYGCPYTQYQLSTTNNYTAGINSVIWGKYYGTINQCNIIIRNLQDKKEEAGYKDILGQAYFLRAFCYFDLARLYQFTYSKNKDKSVCPIYTEPMKITDQGNPLSTVEQVYSLVIADLTEAEKLLEKFVPSDKDRPSPNVVKGLFARVYLTMENWTKAAQYAKAARKGFSLMSGEDFAKGFNSRTNPEWMFMLAQSPDQSNMSYAFHYLDNTRTPKGSSFYASMRPDPFFLMMLEPEDVRRKEMFAWDTQTNKGHLVYHKFRFKSATSSDVDILLMRAAEMWLIEAEALARNTSVAQHEAETVINELRMERNASLFIGLSREKLIEAILLERRRELWGEGFANFDVLRTERAVNRRPTIIDAINNTLDPDLDFSALPLPAEQKPVGHIRFVDPQGNKLGPNNPYFKYIIPEREVINNPNISKP